MSRRHLHRYLNNFDFMYTHSKASDSTPMQTLIGQSAGRRLTYKPLTERPAEG